MLRKIVSSRLQLSTGMSADESMAMEGSLAFGAAVITALFTGAVTMLSPLPTHALETIHLTVPLRASAYQPIETSTGVCAKVFGILVYVLATDTLAAAKSNNP